MNSERLFYSFLLDSYLSNLTQEKYELRQGHKEKLAFWSVFKRALSLQ